MTYSKHISLVKLKSLLREIKWLLLQEGRNHGAMRIHSSVHLHRTVAVQLFGGSVSIDERTLLDRGVGLHAHGGNITIGCDTAVNANTLLIGGGISRLGIAF